MTQIEPKVSTSGRYPIGQAAQILGVHRNTLRRYNDQGLIKSGSRRIGRMDRFFLGSEILRFWRAHM